MPHDNQPPAPAGRAGDAFVRAVINPARKDDALRVLMRLGITGASAHDTVGVDQDPGGEPFYSEWSVLEFRVPGEMQEEVLLALKATVRTSRRNNDGKIFVLSATNPKEAERDEP